MTTFPVASIAAINTLLAGVLMKSGDEIVLAAGSHGSLIIKGKHFAAPGIVIRAADPKTPTTIAGLEVGQSDGLTFAGIDWTTSPRTLSVAWIIESTRVYLSAGNVRDPLTMRGGVLIRTCSDIGIDGTDFSGTGTGCIILGSKNVTVGGCFFHDIYGDGIQTTNSSFVTLTGNRFTDFHPKAGDHPDAMQFFTTGQTTSATNLTISGNVVVRGNGGIIQGVFMGNEASMAYQDVTITKNALVGCMYNGVSITRVDRLSASDNLIQPFSDMGSWMTVNGPASGSVTNNATSQVTAGTGVTVSGTIPLKAVAVGDLTSLDAWLKAHGMTPWGQAPVPTPVPSPTPAPTDWQAIAQKALADDAADKAEIAKLNAALTAEDLQDKLDAEANVAALALKDAQIAALMSQQGSAAVLHAIVVGDRDEDRRAMQIAYDALGPALVSNPQA